MIGYLKGKVVSQVDKLLIDGREYTEAQIKEIVKQYEKDKK